MRVRFSIVSGVSAAAARNADFSARDGEGTDDGAVVEHGVLASAPDAHASVETHLVHVTIFAFSIATVQVDASTSHLRSPGA